MAPELTIEDAVARARKAEERRIEAIRLLVTAQQRVTTAQQEGAERVAQAQREAEEQLRAAEKENAQRYSDALAAGWSAADLRKIGFREPPKHARSPRRRGTTRALDPQTQTEARRPSGAILSSPLRHPGSGA